MRLLYRISDKSYEKQKLIGTSKEVCFMNFCKAFAPVIFGSTESPPDEDFDPPVKVLCDNCDRTTTKMVASSGLPYSVSSEGNAGSLRLAIQTALEYDDDEIVYVSEDDYLHQGTAPYLLEEGIKRSEYVTLYDHPDKYTRYYNGGEFSKVIKTASSHWRYTASTCMTFGCKVKTLREDEEIWMDDELTGEEIPHDHHIFNKLTETRNRRVAVCIPGVACHVDLTFSGLVNYMLMEPWAVEMMIQHLEKETLEMSKGENTWDDMLKVKVGLERLVALDALRMHLLQNK